MPQTRVYKTGSVIYFEGDKAQYVYILKQGVVQSIHISIETGEETREIVKVGEFFGVKSVLGFYPQEETVQVLSNAMVVQLTPVEFEALVSQSPGIVVKMLRVFSNQLRRIGRKNRALLANSMDSVTSETELFKIGEFYYTKKRYKEAVYAYTKYLAYAGPAAEFSLIAKKKLAECKASLGMKLSPDEASAMEADMPSADINDIKSESAGAADDDFGLPPPAAPSAPSKSFDFDAQDAPSAAPAAPVSKASAASAFNFDDLPDLGPAESETPEASGFDVKKSYYNGLSIYSQGKYPEALAIFKEVSIQKQFPAADLSFVEKSLFEIGRCLHKMKNYQEAIPALSDFVKKYPESENFREAIIIIGQVLEEMGQPQKAMAYYTKVAGMNPKDDFTRRAGKLLEALKAKM